MTTVILAAAYLLWMYQRVMHGPVVHERVQGLSDINWRELVTLVPIVVMMFWMGIYPQTFLRKTDASVAALVDRLHSREWVYVRQERPVPSIAAGIGHALAGPGNGRPMPVGPVGGQKRREASLP